MDTDFIYLSSIQKATQPHQELDFHLWETCLEHIIYKFIEEEILDF